MKLSEKCLFAELTEKLRTLEGGDPGLRHGAVKIYWLLVHSLIFSSCLEHLLSRVLFSLLLYCDCP